MTKIEQEFFARASGSATIGKAPLNPVPSPVVERKPIKRFTSRGSLVFLAVCVAVAVFCALGEGASVPGYIFASVWLWYGTVLGVYMLKDLVKHWAHD